MKRLLAMTGTLAALSGCVAPANVPPPSVQVSRPPPSTYGTLGLERVIGKDARTVIALFGKPDLDITEGAGRKLQFVSNICVLDAYLYARGSAVPVVTHVDSRQPDGSSIDRSSCVAALTRRVGGK